MFFYNYVLLCMWCKICDGQKYFRIFMCFYLLEYVYVVKVIFMKFWCGDFVIYLICVFLQDIQLVGGVIKKDEY